MSNSETVTSITKDQVLQHLLVIAAKKLCEEPPIPSFPQRVPQFVLRKDGGNND
ncbi:hypothetical protein [Lysinibacillus xylanilyticus]|uniref:hypothetical protein n=1 Tax=Lysinibacillus xylanilyticus TaxID=582475 RepID=UPI0036D7CCBE